MKEIASIITTPYGSGVRRPRIGLNAHSCAKFLKLLKNLGKLRVTHRDDVKRHGVMTDIEREML